jgi:fibronectin-binding autotransporter adhesin
MAQFQPPLPFNPGDILSAADLNAHVSGAILLPGSINDQTAITAFDIQSTDTFNIYDSSGAVLRKATVDDLMRSGMIAKFDNISGKAGQNLAITPAGGYAVAVNGNLTTSGNFSASGTSILSGDVTAGSALTVTGLATFNTTEAIKLPVGTTAQRPGTPATGQIRFNSTNLQTEVYNGTIWEEVGGGPFDGTGGNQTIAPDNTTYSGTFTSADGLKVVITSAGHSVRVNESIDLFGSIALYSGRCVVKETTTNTFTVYLNVAAVPNSGTCTFKIKRKYKYHIFTSSGTFVAGSKDGVVDVLVVGGGGGGWDVGAGGGGAVVEVFDYPVTAGTTYYATVGNGGTGGNSSSLTPSIGGASVFGTITATGGGVPTNASGVYYNGPSGSGTHGAVSYPGLRWQGGFMYGGAGAGGQSENFVGFGTTYKFRGGNGIFSSISGILTGYGGGGMNGQYLSTGNPSGYTTSSIYGEGTYPPNHDGRPNTGGGGASVYVSPYLNGSNGGSGIVIVRYLSWV